MIISRYNKFVNRLSFTRELKKLRRRINLSIDIPEVIEDYPQSHPRGFIKEFQRRSTSIVEHYLLITKSLDSAHYNERIHALKYLAENVWYSESLSMPLNTARVQLALMKEVIKNRDNRRVQLELLRDFTVASYGHPRAIRKYLKKLELIEVPETGKELKDLAMGWDYHVHDNASYGRKSPTQLLIDAFIKGISELTVAYNNLKREDAIKEVLEAGNILGIRVDTAIEFSALTSGKRFHYMYIMPHFASRKQKFKEFLEHETDFFKNFLHELEENEKKRHANITNLINYFNLVHLPHINEGYQKGTIYYLKPLSVNDEDGTLSQKITSRRLLGEFLYPKLKNVLEKRALQITARYNYSLKNDNEFSKEEKIFIENEYHKIRKLFSELEPEHLRMTYFADNETIQSETGVSSLDDIYALARKTEGRIKFIQPLEHGLQAAIDMVLDNFTKIVRTEVYNMYDSITTKDADFVYFAEFIDLLNKANEKKISVFLKNNKLVADNNKLKKAIEYFTVNKLKISIGSDATGRSTLAPGMGFVFQHSLIGKQKKYFPVQRKTLPPKISELIYLQDVNKEITKKISPQIVCLGKEHDKKFNELGDENNIQAIGFLRLVEYIHPAIKNLILIFIGFLPAYFTVGVEYALLWFTITGSRNIFVDLVAGNGFNPKRWYARHINWNNVANSLFWTGFSVPILNFVKSRFDTIWWGAHNGAMYEFVKFFFINITNGTYLATHNYIRGFDKVTIRANFFRSMLAWPLSALFSPFGNFIGVPSIVQAKFWSDFVAAIIEGSGKYRNIIKIKSRIMNNILPDFMLDDKKTFFIAFLDLLYFITENKRAKSVLYKQLIVKENFFTTLKNFFKRRKAKIKYTEFYFILKNFTDNQNSFQLLTDFIIQNYSTEQSIFLLNMLSNKYNKFKNFLNKMEV